MAKRLLSLVVLMSVAGAIAAFAGDPPIVVPVPGLYEAPEGQMLKMLVPHDWVLVSSTHTLEGVQANGHRAHGMIYMYKDTQGRTHEVSIGYCSGGE